jgi:uncharacterized membrane protein YfcA
MEILFGILIIFAAYFVKGFSGFGPSLIIVPFITLLYDPSSALILTAFFDFFAGAILIYSVRKEVNWSFVLSIFIALGIGTFFGSLLPGRIPVAVLKKIIGAVILIFSFIILLQKNDIEGREKSKYRWLKYPAGILSGFSGGLVSISGPPLVIYMKIMYQKSFFRTQLIGIFLLGTAWRSILYIYHQIPLSIPISSLIIYFIFLLIGLWLGGRLHVKVNEIVFNKIIAIILIIPALNLLFF